jgi:hypothetical protein
MSGSPWPFGAFVYTRKNFVQMSKCVGIKTSYGLNNLQSFCFGSRVNLLSTLEPNLRSGRPLQLPVGSPSHTVSHPPGFAPLESPAAFRFRKMPRYGQGTTFRPRLSLRDEIRHEVSRDDPPSISLTPHQSLTDDFVLIRAGEMPQKSLASFFINERGKTSVFPAPPGVQLNHILAMIDASLKRW